MAESADHRTWRQIAWARRRSHQLSADRLSATASATPRIGAEFHQGRARERDSEGAVGSLSAVAVGSAPARVGTGARPRAFAHQRRNGRGKAMTCALMHAPMTSRAGCRVGSTSGRRKSVLSIQVQSNAFHVLVTLHAMAIAFPPLQRRQCTYASEVRAHALHARGARQSLCKSAPNRDHPSKGGLSRCPSYPKYAVGVL